MKSEGRSLAALLHAVAGVDGLPGVTNQTFSLTSELNATATAIDLSDLEIKLGDTVLMGGIQTEIADIMSANIDLSVKHVNVDKLIGLPVFDPGSTEAAATESTGTATGSGQSGAEEIPGADAGGSPEIPTNLAGALTLVVDAITYRGEKAGPVRLNTELANGEMTISQFSAQLPGAAEIALFGFASVQDGELVFDGESEIAIGDTRRLARWLDVGITQIPNGRLRHIEASANIRASQKDVRILDIKASFDRSNLSGGSHNCSPQTPCFRCQLCLGPH